MSSLNTPRSGSSASAPAAVPVLRNPGGGDTWTRVHETLAGARQIAAARGAIDLLLKALGGDEVSLSKLVVSGGERWMAVVNFESDHATEWWPLAEHPTVERALRIGVPRQLADTDPTADPGEIEVLFAGGYRAMLLLPIEFEGVELGLLEIYSFEPRRWQVGDIAHARAACNQLSTLLMAPSERRAETTAAVLRQV
ncbi:MAG: GAF domain-containing protein [Solirubrobacterales bacterium]